MNKPKSSTRGGERLSSCDDDGDCPIGRPMTSESPIRRGRLGKLFLLLHRRPGSSPISSFTLITLLSAILIFLLFIHMAINAVASRTRTVAGHNLEATPWHPFNLHDRPHAPSASRILHCSYFSCLRRSHAGKISSHSWPPPACPAFFRTIHRDLEPWRRSRISRTVLAEARKYAAMRVVILGGSRLYLDLYYSCVQSRAMFTVWGLLQLLQRYPGMVPDVDLVFDCMDRPVINRTEYEPAATSEPPPPLFRYCTTKEHFDIPFPDWSFWGWSEVNIKPWDEQFREIKNGSQAIPWKMRGDTAYWKGNPDVQSPIRMELLNCNDTKQWKAQIMHQDWVRESNSGFKNSKLSDQCKHRYGIYAEGFAWSVSLKYILSCGSVSLIIDPQYEDFFSRGLIASENYLPINLTSLCPSILSAVDWGNNHPSMAEAIGIKGQKLMEELSMDRVYDYMFHLIMEYSKLQDFKPSPPPSALEVNPKINWRRMLFLRQTKCHGSCMHVESDFVGEAKEQGSRSLANEAMKGVRATIKQASLNLKVEAVSSGEDTVTQRTPAWPRCSHHVWRQSQRVVSIRWCCEGNARG